MLLIIFTYAGIIFEIINVKTLRQKYVSIIAVEGKFLVCVTGKLLNRVFSLKKRP